MRENEYQKLMNDIHVPEGLEERTLWAARKQLAEETAPRRLAKRNWKPVLRGAVCAVCALALVLGTVRLNPAQDDIGTGSVQYDEGLEALTYEFGLTAYAAEWDALPVSQVNGTIAFEMGDQMWWSEDGGYYTGCLLQVTGEGIERISLELDEGAFYRWRNQKGLTEEEARPFRNGEKTGAATPEKDGTWSVQEQTWLGDSVTEEYDPAVRYGFWVQGASVEDWTADTRGAAKASVDELNGANLTVTVTFLDGTERMDCYRLSTGYIVSAKNADGTTTMVPALDGAQGSRYGVYAASQTESTWFAWPVQGSNTISLSNRYGFRAAPGGQGGTFHAGIDIPAPEGEVILAAADGAVTETGFDAKQGNYLVLDHGNGLTTLYAQCRNVEVEEGDTVKAGEMVAAVGATGMATGPHLHFEVRQDGEAQNPVAYFDSEIRDTLKMG